MPNPQEACYLIDKAIHNIPGIAAADVRVANIEGI